jgi:hypothetical protein
MKWVLLIVKVGLGVVSWQGYDTHAKCEVARQVLVHELKLKPAESACFPSNDVVPQ